MSAQIITALRKRAGTLDGEADAIEADGPGELPTSPENPYQRPAWLLRFTASEFRALADQAEAR